MTGKRGAEAEKAYAANPILARIRIKPEDVAQLVPEVTERKWKILLASHPVLSSPDTPAAVQTALLYLAWKRGLGVMRNLTPRIDGRKWLELADAIQTVNVGTLSAQINTIRNRRWDEAPDHSPGRRSPTTSPRQRALSGCGHDENGILANWPLRPGGSKSGGRVQMRFIASPKPTLSVVMLPMGHHPALDHDRPRDDSEALNPIFYRLLLNKWVRPACRLCRLIIKWAAWVLCRRDDSWPPR